MNTNLANDANRPIIHFQGRVHEARRLKGRGHLYRDYRNNDREHRAPMPNNVQSGVADAGTRAHSAAPEDGLLAPVVLIGFSVACGTPPTPVAVALSVPDGAASDVAVEIPIFSSVAHAEEDKNAPGKLPEDFSAAAIASSSRSWLLGGTVDNSPILGGSCDGRVRLP